MTDSEEQRPLLEGSNALREVSVTGGDLEHGVAGSWKEWTAERLEAPATHKTVIALIAIDASCVLADLVYSFLSPDCPCPAPAPCTPHLHPEDAQPAWLSALMYVSLAINTFFLAEIPLALWCFGPAYYLPHIGPGSQTQTPYALLHLFDAFVVLATFVLEVVLHGRERELAGLLVLLRLWRLVKLVGGIAVGAGELNEELSKQLAETERRLSETHAATVRLEAENTTLRARLAIVDNLV